MTYMGMIHYFCETYMAIPDSPALSSFIVFDMHFIQDINNGY